MSSLPEIHFEGYEDEAGGVWPTLVFPDAVNVQTLNCHPVEGMRVLTFMGREAQGEASLHWNDSRGKWVVVEYVARRGRQTPGS